MPPNDDELRETITGIATGVIAPDFVEGIRWSDGTVCTDVESRNLNALALFEITIRKRSHDVAHKRSLRLLRAILSPSQRAQYRRQGDFDVVGSLGGRYRLRPAGQIVQKIEKHGKHWFSIKSYCLHDEIGCPRGDVSIGHMLLLMTDEQEFLDKANHTDQYPDCWNPEYMRRMRQRRESPEWRQRFEEARERVARLRDAMHRAGEILRCNESQEVGRFDDCSPGPDYDWQNILRAGVRNGVPVDLH